MAQVPGMKENMVCICLAVITHTAEKCTECLTFFSLPKQGLLRLGPDTVAFGGFRNAGRVFLISGILIIQIYFLCSCLTPSYFKQTRSQQFLSCKTCWASLFCFNAMPQRLMSKVLNQRILFVLKRMSWEPMRDLYLH